MKQRHKTYQNNALYIASLQAKQPKGGYLPIDEFKKTHLRFNDQNISIQSEYRDGIVVRAVYMLVRYRMGLSPDKVFGQALHGSSMVARRSDAESALQRITGLDSDSVMAALELAEYEIQYTADGFPGDESIFGISDIDMDVIWAIQTMAIRALSFIAQYGPVISHRDTFLGAYTKTIPSGNGEFLTPNMVLELNASPEKPTRAQTLRLLLSWRMGLYSIHPDYGKVKYLGIYNALTNTLYQYDVSAIPDETIIAVDTKIIGYKA